MEFGICCNVASVCDRSKERKDVFSRSEAAIPKLVSMLNYSMSKLPIIKPFEADDSTRLAWFVYNSMITKGRLYHSMSHVFDISKGVTDPIIILSALFHDVIYVQIDKTFNEDQAKVLEGVLVPNTEPLALAADLDDPLVSPVTRLFGFSPGAELPKVGTNEFISGIIAVRILAQWLTFPYLMQIAACIEGTIPFRPIIDEKTPMERLYERLADVCSDESSEEWLVETVQKAAITANCDLCSFSSDDCDFFLDSSWKLIPEFRPSLLSEDCPLMEYLNELHALEGRSKFLKDAVPRIFQTFRQVPSDSVMEEKRAKTHANLDVLMQYANVRLLQLMVLVEFALAIDEKPQTLPLRPFLRMTVSQASTRETGKTLTNTEEQVRNWLIEGRRNCFSWDPAISSLGVYLFDTLGTIGINRAIEIGKNQKEGSHDVLRFLPKYAIDNIASSLAVLLPDQAGAFLKVPETIEHA